MLLNAERVLCAVSGWIAQVRGNGGYIEGVDYVRYIHGETEPCALSVGLPQSPYRMYTFTGGVAPHADFLGIKRACATAISTSEHVHAPWMRICVVSGRVRRSCLRITQVHSVRDIFIGIQYILYMYREWSLTFQSVRTVRCWNRTNVSAGCATSRVGAHPL